MANNRKSVPTIVDVAAAAGVSRGTASNVFTHPERVRPQLRAHVEKVSERLGYAGPDPRARLLRAGRHGTLGFVIPGAYGIVNAIESPYGRELLLGVGEACDLAGVALTLLDGRPEQMDAAVRGALVDGIVLGHGNAPQLLDAARRRRLKVVVLDTSVGPEFGAVTIAARSGAAAAARHLLEFGHTRFAIVSVRRTHGVPVIHAAGDTRLAEGFPLDVLKLDGYLSTLAENGIRPADVPLVEAVPWQSDLYRIVRDLAPRATAWLVMSDRQSLTILADMDARRIPRGKRPSVVGFDNVPAADTAGLTTISQPIREKGRLAASMLLSEESLREIPLPCELIVRKSSSEASV